MVVQRASPSKRVADVVVPEHLLATVRRGGPSVDGDGPIQNAIQRHVSLRREGQLGRSATLSHGLRPRQYARATRARNTSDPTTIAEVQSVRTSIISSPVSNVFLKQLPRSDSISRQTLTFDELGDKRKRTVSFDKPMHARQSAAPYVSHASYASYASSASSLYTTDPPSIFCGEELDQGDFQTQGLVPQRSGTVRTIVDKARNVAGLAQKGTIHDVYERAKKRGVQLERKRWVQIVFEYSVYFILLSFTYFVLIGMPLWRGAVYWLYWVVQHKFVLPGGWSITIGMAVLYSFTPLLIFFEKEPPIIERPDDFDRNDNPGVRNTALLIPCYKSANIIGPTLDAALKIFPPSNVFVVANGNSPTPLDSTEEVCRPYGVNHIWSPVGSKIVAQFVGCYAAKGFENVLLIDDDCALPPNFPVVSERLSRTVQSIGYTIKSVGPESSKGTWCQQAQDLEYKLSGLQRALAGKVGSATFPHGAISLWNRQFLIQTFHDHPGFSVSEDWFFGHSCRRLGGRIKMCTSVFVETETPSAVFFSSGGSRGGFGEMTVFKQRFIRWNFFFVNGMWYNLAYILFSWKLGWCEIGAKVFVFQEVYETLLYLFTPFILVISFLVQPGFSGILFGGTMGLYLLNVLIFNEVHLRMRKERISWTVLLVYYMPYKLVLTLINVGSCYWSLFKYAQYFAKRHPKVIEDEKAVEVVMRLEETTPVQSRQNMNHDDEDLDDAVAGRRMHVTTVGTRINSNHDICARNSIIPGLETVDNMRNEFLPGAQDRISWTPSGWSGSSDYWENDIEHDDDLAMAAAPRWSAPRRSFDFGLGRRKKTDWSQSPL